MKKPILVPVRSRSSLSISITPDTSAFCARSADALFRWIGTGAIVEVHDAQRVCIMAWIEDRLECGMANAAGIMICPEHLGARVEVAQ